MQLQALAGLQAQRDALDARRGAQAVQLYEQGLGAFAQAAQGGFHNKALLQTALEAWMQAVRQQRSHPDPCIALGYLFHMLGDARNAVMYLKTAQRLAPDHPDPPLLLELLLQRPARPSPVSADGGDGEWERLEGLLRGWRERLRQWPPAAASLEPAICLTLSQRRDALQSGLQELQRDLNILEQEQDVTPLRQQLLPLEQGLQSYLQALKQSQLLRTLQQDLVSCRQAVSTASQSGLDTACLEQLLDDCDALADRVEALETDPASAPLLRDYAELAEAVERLQDSLDEGAL